MDERCKLAHERLIAGTCPWCGRAIIDGRIDGSRHNSEIPIPDVDVDVDFEFYESQSLWELVVNGGPIDHERAATFILEIARQLIDFYGTNTFHGAVQPDNVYIDKSGAVRLGPALYVIHSATVLKELFADVTRSANWLAPEQALISREADERTDIYSLGCTMYFLLVGNPPFGEGTIAERLLHHQKSMPDQIRDIRPNVPAELAQICEKMLAKKPGDRFQSMNDIAKAMTSRR